MFETREGEVRLASDPAAGPGDGHVVFIGRIASPWKTRDECPKNMAAARQTGRTAQLVVDEPFRPGLAGLAGASHVVILSWLQHSPRDLIVQKPRHAETAKGVFALRSPVRPNPIGLFCRSMAPALDVMIRITLRKSTDLPLWSVSLPWSITCNRML